jgi:hypothetical protein
MEWHNLLVEGYRRVQESMEHVLTGLDQDVLDWQPKDGNNTIGWLAWHLTRQQDAQIASLMSKDQLWIRGKWYQKFKRLADPKDSGFGHTKEQIKAFKSPDINTLIDYQKAVFERSKDYFMTLSKSDLEKELNEPWFQPLPTVGVRLISILEDSLLHAGQMAYIRGLRQGKGWQKY